MRPELSRTLLLFGNRALTVLAVGTIISVTAWAESLQRTFPGAVTIPILLVSAGGVLTFIPLFAAGFVEEFGTPIAKLFFTRRKIYGSKDLTIRGEALAKRMGIKKRITFKVRRGLKTAYSIGKSVVIGEVFVKVPGESEAVTGHELTHLTRYNYWGRVSRLFLYFSPGFVLLWREAWLPLQVLYPYALALALFPLKWSFHWGEYHADEGGARVTSPETMIAVLLHLKDMHGDDGSFTHPSISKRIRRLQKKFGQAH